ncbi:hypothetical protein TorRG33x02_239790 [Trema orientale]|uniref:Uncharacterized protein n=1 Tax=Trema orientale TaxID=63057 RepID=A0A2P5DWG7_TREOI|nr:hypothetical protein TorRG33x02_239790 [Trema orientale]
MLEQREAVVVCNTFRWQAMEGSSDQVSSTSKALFPDQPCREGKIEGTSVSISNHKLKSYFNPDPDKELWSKTPGTNTGSWFEVESRLNLDSRKKFIVTLSCPSLEPEPFSFFRPSLNGTLKSGPPKNMESPVYISFSACCNGGLTAEDEDS